MGNAAYSRYLSVPKSEKKFREMEPVLFFFLPRSLMLVAALALVGLSAIGANSLGEFQDAPGAWSAVLFDTKTISHHHHRHQAIKTTLDFAVKTLNHALQECGGETLKTLQADSSLQNRIKTLSLSFKDQVLAIASSMDSGSGHAVRRRTNTTSLDIIDVDDISVDDSDFRSLRIERSTEFVAVTLGHWLDVFGGSMYSNKLQTDLQLLARPVAEQIIDMAKNMARLKRRQLTNSDFKVPLLVILVVLAAWVIYQYEILSLLLQVIAATSIVIANVVGYITIIILNLLLEFFWGVSALRRKYLPPTRIH